MEAVLTRRALCVRAKRDRAFCASCVPSRSTPTVRPA